MQLNARIDLRGTFNMYLWIFNCKASPGADFKCTNDELCSRSALGNKQRKIVYARAVYLKMHAAFVLLWAVKTNRARR
jgi:hypothetical protein